jgi:hypothetical protein
VQHVTGKTYRRAEILLEVDDYKRWLERHDERKVVVEYLCR